MPISNIGGVIIETPISSKDQFIRCGVILDSEFALCDEVDRLKQIKFNATPLATGSTLILAAASGDAGGTITLPASGSTLAANVSILQSSVPATAATITVSATTNALIIKPAADIADLTITMPAGVNGKILRVASSKAVTNSLTVTGVGGNTVLGAPATLTANSFFSFVYETATTTWYRIG